MLLMSAVNSGLQDSLQQQQSNQRLSQLGQQHPQQQLSMQHSLQELEQRQQQQQPGSFSRLRSLLRWMPSAPLTAGDAAALLGLPGVTQRSHSSMGTAASGEAVTTRNLRSDLCRDSVSSAARWDWLRQSQASSPEAGPDSIADSLSRSSASSAASSLQSSRSSSRNSNGGSTRMSDREPAVAAALHVEAAGVERAHGSDDGGSCVISIGEECQQQQAMEGSSIGGMSSVFSGRVDGGSCAGASTATCSSSLASQQQLRQAWWQQQQPSGSTLGHVGDTSVRAAGCIDDDAAVQEPAAMWASFSARSAASAPAATTEEAALLGEAAATGVPAIHPSEWLGFMSVGVSAHAGSAAAVAAGGAGGSLLLNSRLLEEAAAAAAAGGAKPSAGPSPFQLHYDFSAL
jgi:hypothetical protein